MDRLTKSERFASDVNSTVSNQKRSLALECPETGFDAHEFDRYFFQNSKVSDFLGFKFELRQ